MSIMLVPAEPSHLTLLVFVVSLVSINDFPCGYLGTHSRLLMSYGGGCQTLDLKN